MKDFSKIVWGSALGFLIMTVISGIFSFIVTMSLIGSMAAGSSSTVTYVPEGSILNIDMSTLVIAEQTLEDNPFTSMSRGMNTEEIHTVGILDAVKALELAATDPNIKLAYIRPDAAGSIAHLEEFRSALVKFRQSGKALIAYMETPTNAGYYLASAADRIYMSEYHGGMNMLVGLSGQLVFVKDLLDFLGVNMQLIRHGKYKAAGEMYIRNSASPENMEQNTVMIKSMWNELVAPMAERANMSKEQFNALLDNLKLVDAGDFLKYGLVDELVGMEGMRSKLCVQAGVEKYNQIQSVSLADYALLKVQPNLTATERIAVIYTDGQIIDGRGVEEVAGKRFADMISEVAADDKVKAVVLRVNSPGGSVVAASQIKDALDALHTTKPIIASYGNYAASGGYWISACSDYIFSDATTLTGSIGVFGTIPDFSKAVRKAKVNITNVPSNKHSDMYSAMRPLSAEEVAYVQKDIEHIYTAFTSLVAEGRQMPVSKVDELGQGRVWTGRDALANGLVDEIGGLKEALEYAANVAGCTNYQLVSYPKPLTIMEQLLQAFQPQNNDYLVKFVRSAESMGKAQVFARLPYDIEIR